MTKIRATFFASGLALAAMAGGAMAEGKIAYFAAASQNGFNQATYAGVEEMAAKPPPSIGAEIFHRRHRARRQQQDHRRAHVEAAHLRAARQRDAAARPARADRSARSRCAGPRRAAPAWQGP